ncbi:unnamed protein product [Closterium sp. NIES-65]|nr:unnamed protein product [Closterium sp. NIES-65]
MGMGSAGDGERRDGERRDGERRDGERRDGERRDGERRDGERRDGERRDGERRDGERRDGERRDGERRDGVRRDGERRDGERRDGERRGWGAEGWGAEGWGAGEWGAEGWGAEGWGAEGWGAGGWGAEGWGAGEWGAEGWGAEGWGAEGWGAGGWGAEGWGAGEWGAEGWGAGATRSAGDAKEGREEGGGRREGGGRYILSWYYFRAGTGGGKNMWLIYLPGGGWCGTAAQCVARSKTLYGTSTLYPTDPEPNAALRPPFNGILSSNSTINPPFYNWNLVRLIYCDGCGYSGTAGRLEADSNGTVLYLDGRNIVQAVIEDLKAKGGITSAAQILLSGSSAGGQAVVSLCDRIAAAFPWAPTKCIADAGFFIDSKDRVGGYTWRNTVKDVVALHKPSWPICQDGEMRKGEKGREGARRGEKVGRRWGEREVGGGKE